MDKRKLIPLIVYGIGILILALIFIIVVITLEIPDVQMSPGLVSCVGNEDCYTGENPCVRQLCIDGFCESQALENVPCYLADNKIGTCVQGYCEGCSEDSDCSDIGVCGNMECKFKRWDNKLCIPVEECKSKACSEDSECETKECWLVSCMGGKCNYSPKTDGEGCMMIADGYQGSCQGGWCIPN